MGQILIFLFLFNNDTVNNKESICIHILFMNINCTQILTLFFYNCK